MQLPSDRPSSSTRRSAAIWTVKFAFSTTVRPQTAAMISSEIGERQDDDRHARHLGSAARSAAPVGSRHRRCKPVAARGYRLNAAPLRSPLVEYPAECGDLDRQVRILDDGAPPNGRHDLL